MAKALAVQPYEHNLGPGRPRRPGFAGRTRREGSRQAPSCFRWTCARSLFTFKEDIQSKGTLTFQLPPLFAKSLAWPLKLGLSISLLFFGQSSVSKEARDTLQF